MPTLETPQQQIRLTEASDANGGGTSPDAISSALFDQDADMPNSAGLSNLFVAWGQFLDHDITLSPESETETLTQGNTTIHRSEFELDEDGNRVPLNAITWAIDGSQIYGSTEPMTDLLRGDYGHLRMGEDQWSDMGLLPKDHANLMAGGGQCPFMAGDVRANENPALNAMHTLMAREHNYWADRLAEEHPDWTDDQVFDGARQIVEFELQQITYNEWLPHLAGDTVSDHTGHDPDADGQISVEFSTAAFRFGHTMVSSTIPSMNEDGSTGEAGDMAIQDVFFDADPLRTGGIDDILRGQAASHAQEVDTKVVDDLNFALFNDNGANGQSLVAFNLLRGQDHGLQSYVDTRAALLGDIDPATLDPGDFSIITADPALQAELAAVYDTVHDVDLWVGGLAEDALPDTQMGPIFTYVITDQFDRIRAADETFGQLDPGLGEAILTEVQNSTLSDIILRNTQIDMLQDDPFVMAPRGLTDVAAMDGTENADVLNVFAQNILGALTTGAGNDTVTLVGGSRVGDGVDLGPGHDTFAMSSGSINGCIDAGEGRDTILLSGEATVDAIATGNGKDSVTLTEAAFAGKITTANGKDYVSIAGRAGADLIDTGNGKDSITLGHGANVGLVDGGSGKDSLTVTGGRYRIDWQDNDPHSGAGRVVYLNKDGSETGKGTDFVNIETVTCFTPGTRIITATGAVAIEDLCAGDRIYTLDGGLQPLRWVGRTTVLAQGPHAPVRIQSGALGNARTMEVSPQHRMMLSDWRCDVVCGTDEVLAPALHLLNDCTITRRTGGTVDYIHLLFDDHQIVFADGIPSESFHPGPRGIAAMPDATRAELLSLFPQLAADLDSFGPAARYCARAHEVRVITGL
ncbi:peroxidase family protein [Yoonia sp. R2331]|uniref:peroxidase family protein n=1 Tax=Yoonia sp. R2331 TaxID=3237238 RepID=UPI0034E520B2